MTPEEQDFNSNEQLTLANIHFKFDHRDEY